MEISKEPLSHNLRVRTDQSLQDERLKTDEQLVRKAAAVTEETEDAIRDARKAADEHRDSVRAEADSDHTDSQDPAPDLTQPRNQKLMDERERNDSAQRLERSKEDSARSRERFRKRLIAEALLETERNRTDGSLFDERDGIDREALANAELLYAEKNTHDLTKTALALRDTFLAVVSHDLKNPLGSISMSVILIQMALAEGEGAIDVERLGGLLDIIGRSTATMDRMIGDLLDVERMAHGKVTLTPQKEDIGALLRECTNLFAPITESRSFSMTVKGCTEPLFGLVDHDRVLQVLSNLAGNALKFAPPEGKVILSCARKSGTIEISVSDNGPGISEEKKAKLFERYSQLGTNDRRGLGLGLFISKWIVEAHGGEIWVDSEEGKGTCFTFSVPEFVES